MSAPPAEIAYGNFVKVGIRVGTIVQAELYPEARKPMYKLGVDFGAASGVKRSAVQITDLYVPDDLVGRQVVAVVTFAP